MKFGKALFLLAATTLVNAQIQWISFDVDLRSNLWEITGVTPATRRSESDPVDNSVHVQSQWVRRWGLAWYFDRFCPCNWGCPEMFCFWCAGDDRWPSWYRNNDNATLSSVAPWFECTDDIEDNVNGVRILHEETIPEDDGFEVVTTLESNAQVVDSYIVNVHGPTTNGFWSTSTARRSDMILRITNRNIIGFTAWNSAMNTYAVQAHLLGVNPSGIMLFPVVFGNSWNYGAAHIITITLLPERVSVPLGIDTMVYREIIAQHIVGRVLSDVPMQSLNGSPYVWWRLELPRAGYGVYVSSGDNDMGVFYDYPKVNEILCGAPTDPSFCRSHSQMRGRVVNRFASRFDGIVAPWINRTIYEWDIAASGSSASERHKYRILGVDRHSVNGPYAITIERSMFNSQDYELRENSLMYNKKNPQLSYKLY